MIAVSIAVGAVVVLALAALLWRRRSLAFPADRLAEQADDHVRGIVSMPAEAAADTIVPEPAPPTRPRLRQCPRCGRHAVSGDHGDVSCGWCGLAWHQPADAPWPDVNLCLWIPPSDRPAVKEKT